MREEKSIVRAYIFYGIWFLSCSFPFWFLSQYFSPRYFYISYIALTTITFITVYQALILPTRYRQQIATISIIIIFSLYGAQRYLMNADMFNKWNGQLAQEVNIQLDEYGYFDNVLLGA